ncbi:Protein of unknown function (DUF1212) [Geosmithia morbida]|uniref:Threonine/serine exporter-like N-terminal domain-containing protein n=1 Tax=Geosmithia morbida TaxID=1094350 RepID=A0A9P4Z3X8_9HYPO|nr:Protein of unknown function (DUF1212) [Geosmithia morbida]KAF4126984.1 Protein of unknown function (DUF1212) [Geosmithia morbida]
MSSEQLDSGAGSSSIPTPLRKEKKRVGWHASSDSGGSARGGAGSSQPPPPPDAKDYFESPAPSPRPPEAGSVPPGAPDAQELSRALSKILTNSPEVGGDGQAMQLQPLPSTSHQETRHKQGSNRNSSYQSPRLLPTDQDANLHLGVSRPRPALRRNTSYDGPQAREEADRAEQQVNERTLRSMTDARNRADQLALSLGSLGSRSAPGSRRNSDDMDASFQSLVGDSGGLHPLRGRAPRPAVVVEDYDGARDAAAPSRNSGAAAPWPDRGRRGGTRSGATTVSPGVSATHKLRQRVRRRMSYADDDQDSFPLDDHDGQHHNHHGMAASQHVHYTLDEDEDDSNSLYRTPAHASGTTTPVDEQGYVQDYVPRPKKYRGGVLSYLLKLENHERLGGGGGGSNGSSGRTTPALSTVSTPVMSPQSSPPRSRSASRVRGARPGRSSGLFNLHRSQGSASSLTLTELMKSSTSMFAAPGSSEISDRMADRFKREHPPHNHHHKPKKDKARITIHIAGIISRHRYLLKLCRALMLYGAPTHRLEEYMSMSARVLEIEGQFLYLPSCMIISFDDSTTHTAEVKLVRVAQGVDLGRLRDVHNIYKEVVHDKLGVEEATKKLDLVMSRKPKFSVWFRVFLYGVASACVGPFAFQGRFIDMPFAFILGSLVGILQLVFAPSNELYAHVFEVSAAMLTSFLARAFGSIGDGETICFGALAQSAIALILPGYMVLCSSLELQSHNIVAGSVRMVHAMIYTLFLGYGITIGASLYGMLDSNAPSTTGCKDPLGREWYFLFVPAFTLCLCLVNQAKWKQTPVMLVMALAGFCTNSYCSEYFNQNTEISNMLGALTIGILANLYSRLGRHVENGWLDLVEWWQFKVAPRLARWRRKSGHGEKWPLPTDPESRPGSPLVAKAPVRQPRQVGYSLAAAAMLPAIFVQVPSGLAAGGSLLAGVTSADELTSKNGSSSTTSSLDGTAFTVLFKVIQVAIGISVGLFMSALIVYPLGKRRSGLFSF